LITIRGATTAEKLRGTKVWVPHLGACAPRPAKGTAGCRVREGGAPVRVRGYYPPKVFDNLDAKFCILVTTCCEMSCFLKATAKKWGNNTVVAPMITIT